MMFWLEENWPPMLGLLVIVGALAGFCLAVNAGIQGQQRFMAECQQDHKRYECEAMWRAGENHSSTVVMPVVVAR